jgi:hypothetical protein
MGTAPKGWESKRSADKHRPPSFSLLKKDLHAQTLRHFQRAEVLRIMEYWSDG